MNLTHATLGLGGGRLWQLANRSPIQTMSYLIEAPDGRLIMIDGGYYRFNGDRTFTEDGEFLHHFLKEKGGHISAWFITHAHEDHFGALAYMLRQPWFDLTIDCLYYDFPDDTWINRLENGRGAPFINDFYEAVAFSGVKSYRTHTHELFDFGVKIEVLNSPVDCSKYRGINDSTICLRVSFPKRDILFLGDIDIAGEHELIAASPDRLRCDIVQMAHHGQDAADRELYEMICPKICLWPTPDWLWNNDIGGGPGSGPWNTPKYRRWMDELGVTENYVQAFGDYVFD